MNPIFYLWNHYVLDPLLAFIDNPAQVMLMLKCVGLATIILVFLIIRGVSHKQDNLV